MVYRSSKMSVILSNVAINKNQLVSYVLEIILMLVRSYTPLKVENYNW